jgi:uncharacterized membrane protein
MVSIEELKKEIVKPKSKKQRFIEIDILRGLAIFLMVFGHLLWDLDYFGIVTMNNGFYSFLQSFVPQLFFVLVGVSLIVAKKRIENNPNISENAFYKRLMFRGLKIIGLGMILTVGSLIFFPEKPVFFGVLHCIGLSIILCIPFLKFRSYNVVFASGIILAGYMLGQIHFANPNLAQLIIGFHQIDVWKYTIDYFPILPWFGIALLGVFVGDILYCGNERRFRIPDMSKSRVAKVFSWMGQHSLGIYLIHQPILAGIISVFVFF